jgi:hypothetical protein
MAKKRTARTRPDARDASASSGGRASPPAWIAAVGLVVLVGIVFLQTRDFGFVNWDDPQYLTANPHVSAGLTGRAAWWALTTGYPPYWHPLTWLSHLTDVELFGMDAGAHHLVNVLLHACSSVALFVVLRRMTGAYWPSAFAAAMFAVHPLHVESVAWISERKDVLSTLGVWIAIGLYARYVAHPSLPAYLAMAGAFALALMAKPMVVTLPAVLLVLDVWPLRRLTFEAGTGRAWRRAAIEKLPLVAVAVAAGIATWLLQEHVGATAGFDVLPWHIRAANALVAVASYLGHALVPTDLAAFYPYPRAFPVWMVGGAAALLVSVTAVSVALRRNRP